MVMLNITIMTDKMANESNPLFVLIHVLIVKWIFLEIIQQYYAPNALMLIITGTLISLNA